MRSLKVGVLCAGTGGTKIGAEAFQACSLSQFTDSEGAPEFVFIETNMRSIEELLSLGVAREDAILIGYPQPLGGHGSANDPKKAASALMPLQTKLMERIQQWDLVFIVVTGGKGTGMGTFPLLLEWALSLRKWVIPVFAEPAIEGEVDALTHGLVMDQIQKMRALNLRVLHIVNATVFDESNPYPLEESFQMINYSIGGGLASIAKMLAEGKQIDLSDLAQLLAGPGDLYLGHGGRSIPDHLPSMAEVQTAAQEMAQACLGLQFLRFEGKADQVLWGVTVPKTWPAWVQKEMVAAGTRQLTAKLGEKALPNKILPPARFRVTEGQWGLTVLMNNDTGVHERLGLPEIELDPNTVQVQVQRSPVSIPRLVPAATAIPAEPATTIHRDSATVSEFVRTTNPTITLGKFIQGINRGDETAHSLLENKGVANGWVIVTEQELRKFVPQQMFRDVFNGVRSGPAKGKKLSDECKARLLQEIGKIALDDLQVFHRRTLRNWGGYVSLRDLQYVDFRSVQKEDIERGEVAWTDFAFIKAVVEFWGEEGYRVCQNMVGQAASTSMRKEGNFSKSVSEPRQEAVAH